MSKVRVIPLVIGVIVMLFCIIAIPNLFENLDASDVMVIQSPVSGEMTAYTEPGLKWQGFGTVSKFPRRAEFSFSSKHDQGNSVDESISTRFNDGGHGNLSGVINWTMPLKPEQIIALKKDFGSYEAIEQQLMRPAVQKVIYTVGPTMSSTESSAERRPEIPKFIDDQLANGPYMTKTAEAIVDDPISGKKKTINVVQIVMDSSGKPVREAISQISHYGIQLQPVTIENIKYDDIVEKQIKERQNATTQVQISIANARKAEQDAITTAKQGEAEAAKAKWAQETINAKEVAQAEKELKVAQLAAQTAEQKKRAAILEGEGEATKRKLIMEADGALGVKVDAVVAISKAYAEAIKSAQPGAWTPVVQMSAHDGGSGSSAQALVDMMTAKTAKDLGVDLKVTGAAQTSKK